MGSRFGTTQGFTQRGCTGMMVPPGPTLPELEGLNASAVAVALTLFPVLPQTREKKFGKLPRVTCTVTMGLTAKAAVRPEQSVLEPKLPPLPAE